MCISRGVGGGGGKSYIVSSEWGRGRVRINQNSRGDIVQRTHVLKVIRIWGTRSDCGVRDVFDVQSHKTPVHFNPSLLPFPTRGRVLRLSAIDAPTPQHVARVTTLLFKVGESGCPVLSPLTVHCNFVSPDFDRISLTCRWNMVQILELLRQHSKFMWCNFAMYWQLSGNAWWVGRWGGGGGGG